MCGQNTRQKDGELSPDSVIKDYLTTAADEKKYNVTFYSCFQHRDGAGGTCCL